MRAVLIPRLAFRSMVRDSPPPTAPILALDWTWDEAEYHAKQVKLYTRAVLTRVMPSLAELTPSEMQAVIESPELVPIMPFEGDIAPAGGDDLYTLLMNDLGFVRHEVFGLAFAGLFHLFEKTLMGALSRNHGRSGGRLIRESERELKLPMMQRILKRGGYPIEGSDFEVPFSKLRLISGTAKHAPGQSARQLAAAFPELMVVAPGDIPSHLSLMLSPELFRELSDAVIAFWRGFPQPIPPLT